MNRQSIVKRVRWSMGVLAASVILSSSSTPALSAQGGCGGGSPDPKVVLRHTMHKLWAERGLWMRSHLIAMTSGTPDSSPAASRLLRNTEDIGNAVAPFMGIESANKLAQLLKTHTLNLLDAIADAASGDKGRLEISEKKYCESALEIAIFMSKSNSNWRQPNLIDAWERNLMLALNEISARRSQRWAEDIIAADRNLEVMMTMAEGFAEGLIMQYPAKFPAKF